MENLKALVNGRETTPYQRALALSEFIAMERRLNELEQQLKNCNLQNVNARFPQKEELEKECELYMDSIIKETDYRDRPIHIKHAFKAGINYLNEFLNGR